MIPPGRGVIRATVAALVLLALFSFASSALISRDLWPQLPPGLLHGSDLVSGFLAAAALILLLALETPNRRGHAPDTGSGPGDGVPDDRFPSSGASGDGARIDAVGSAGAPGETPAGLPGS